MAPFLSRYIKNLSPLDVTARRAVQKSGLNSLQNSKTKRKLKLTTGNVKFSATISEFWASLETCTSGAETSVTS